MECWYAIYIYYINSICFPDINPIICAFHSHTIYDALYYWIGRHNWSNWNPKICMQYRNMFNEIEKFDVIDPLKSFYVYFGPDETE